MNDNHVPFWIASDLLAHAQAYGVALPEDFTSGLVGIVRAEQRQWMTEKREAEQQRRYDARRKRLWDARGWF
jgi:hypothetical protein